MKLEIEVARDENGRWIAQVPSLAGVLVFGSTEIEARAKARESALGVLAGRQEPQAVEFDRIDLPPRDLDE